MLNPRPWESLSARRAQILLLAAAFLLLLPGSSFQLNSVHAQGVGAFDPQCAARPESGVWVARSPRNKDLARLELQIDCRNGLYLARAFVRCGRTECSWGYAQAVAEDEAMKMVFEGFNALYYVSTQYAGAAGLNVTVTTDYRSADKADAEARYVLERDN